jgi:hypothetical protein
MNRPRNGDGPHHLALVGLDGYEATLIISCNEDFQQLSRHLHGVFHKLTFFGRADRYRGSNISDQRTQLWQNL